MPPRGIEEKYIATPERGQNKPIGTAVQNIIIKQIWHARNGAGLFVM